MIVYQQVEGYQEDMPEQMPNPKTGRDEDDFPTNGVESMTIEIRDAGGVTHEGDMGRLGQSE
jgi:hypothetical protein